MLSKLLDMHGMQQSFGSLESYDLSMVYPFHIIIISDYYETAKKTALTCYFLSFLLYIYSNVTTVHHVWFLLSCIVQLVSSCSTYQLLLSTASPNPGVSTIVSRNCTPFSFKTTFVLSTWKHIQNTIWAAAGLNHRNMSQGEWAASW